MIAANGVSHIRFTVTDLERSRAFYTEVLGLALLAQSDGDPADPAVRSDPDRLFGGVLLRGPGLVLGLRPVADPADRFDPDRVGLDHLSFSVGSRAELDEAAKRLAERGVPHGEVRVLPAFGMAILSFEDPDGIQLELTGPAS